MGVWVSVCLGVARMGLSLPKAIPPKGKKPRYIYVFFIVLLYALQSKLTLDIVIYHMHTHKSKWNKQLAVIENPQIFFVCKNHQL